MASLSLYYVMRTLVTIKILKAIVKIPVSRLGILVKMYPFVNFLGQKKNKEQVDKSPKCRGMWINHGLNMDNPASCSGIAAQNFGDTKSINNFEVCEGDVDSILYHRWKHHKFGKRFLL